MKALLGVLTIVVFLGVLFTVPTAEASGALTICALFSIPVIVVLLRNKIESEFLIRLFLAGLLIRIIVGTVINVLEMQGFFGPDALTYDFYGSALVKAWAGDPYFTSAINTYFGGLGATGWGWVYMVGAIYRVIGRNMLAIQFTNAAIGAATAPTIFFIAYRLFKNRRVARTAGLFVAFFPSLILWSSQGLKDAPIVFLLALAILLTLKLTEKFNVINALSLCLVLASIISFRFYIFFMITVAVVGAFIIGTGKLTPTTFIRQLLVVACIGTALTYMGVLRLAQQQAGFFGDLRIIEASRADLSQRAVSGFGRDFDVSTPEGAISVVPLGVVYLLFAPFPWEIRNLRQSITLPEMLIWWACFPLLILGLWFTIRYRLRQAFVILIFTTMLTLAYSIFQGNVGTAYRQRAQLLVFYFIFVAVGYVLLREKREEKKQPADAAPQHPEERPRDRRLPISAASPAKAN